MAVGYTALPELLSIPGVRIGACAAGIRYQGRNDLVLFELAQGSRCAAMFTKNAFCAAPVIVAREHLASGEPHYLLINSGNANAGTGRQGLDDARRSCALVGAQLGCDASRVLPFSTGVIGQRLPVERVEQALPMLVSTLSDTHWELGARAIMTTDTVAKGVSQQAEIDGRRVTLTGIAKGAGMIRPDMATMLAFIATDASVDPGFLNASLHRAVDRSFNRITVDGDTSTNDACVLVATGMAGNFELKENHPQSDDFQRTLDGVCERLAQLIVRDAEGATKFITVEVSEGRDRRECLQVAYTIAHSPLVKTAMFASDPNWGRILAAVGRAGIDQLDIDRVSIFIGDVCIVRDGGVSPAYTEAAGQAAMKPAEITIRVSLGRGNVAEQVWTCDFSHDYVTINAEYRT